MVIDTSALVAILFDEPDAELYANALASASRRILSAVTRVELAFVIEGRKGEAGRAHLENLLAEGDFEVVAVTAHTPCQPSKPSVASAAAVIAPL